MNGIAERNLDLNLLRVLVAVADTGSVTAASRRLYVTQSAVSAALGRLATAIGAPVVARAGRGIALTSRGERLLAECRPHLEALLRAAVSPGRFDPRTSERSLRVGLSDASEGWLLPPLLRALTREAPGIRLVVIPVQFRTVADALAAARIDLAVTVADELPAGVSRHTLFVGDFVCVFDPRHARPGRSLTLERYLAHEHVVVSYNGDTRGIVEDVLGATRRVRVSLPSFHSVGSVVEGGPLLATVPARLAREIVRERRALRTTKLPFTLRGAATELVVRGALAEDEAVRFVCDRITRIGARGAG